MSRAGRGKRLGDGVGDLGRGDKDGMLVNLLVDDLCVLFHLFHSVDHDMHQLNFPSLQICCFDLVRPIILSCFLLMYSHLLLLLQEYLGCLERLYSFCMSKLQVCKSIGRLLRGDCAKYFTVVVK